jgi:hypothetical protein
LHLHRVHSLRRGLLLVMRDHLDQMRWRRHELAVLNKGTRVRPMMRMKKLARAKRIGGPDGMRVVCKRRLLLVVVRDGRGLLVNVRLAVSVVDRLRCAHGKRCVSCRGVTGAPTSARNDRKMFVALLVGFARPDDRAVLALPLPRCAPHLFLARVVGRHGRKRRRIRRRVRPRIRTLELGDVHPGVPSRRSRLPVSANAVGTIPHAFAALPLAGFAALVRSLVFVGRDVLLGLVGHERDVLPVHRVVWVGRRLVRGGRGAGGCDIGVVGLGVAVGGRGEARALHRGVGRGRIKEVKRKKRG